MVTGIKTQFITGWETYFPGPELPICFYYTDDEGHGEAAPKAEGWKCVICDLARVRQGQSVYFNADAIGCSGGRRYFGLSRELGPDIEYFLSCGIPGKMEGERYKKSPEMVREIFESQPSFKAPGKYIVFKRWDMLDESNQPLGVIFFARPDVLSGLFTLANFDEVTPHGVMAPFGSGCSSIVYHPYMESLTDHPRAILGMFDPSARPCVPSGILTFSIPWSKFAGMVGHMDESHLITETWNKTKERISRNYMSP